jgi:large subunit ribosomal protein L6
MSRVGKLPIPVPGTVNVSLAEGVFKAKGPKGELTVAVPAEMSVEIGEKEITVKRPSDSKQHKAMHGLARSLVNSVVVGVSEGFEKKLQIIGVGWRAEMKGKNLVMHLGYSHPHTVEPKNGVEFETPDQTTVLVKGADKQAVGQVAAEIRSLRPPEPYKGKGVKYADEVIRRKAGKTAGS